MTRIALASPSPRRLRIQNARLAHAHAHAYPHPAPRAKTRARIRPIEGFGLIDLMLALLVLALVFSFAVPTWNDFVSRSHATAARTALTTSLFDAMREAAIVGRPVVVCPDGDGVCAGGTDWSRGWIAFVDRDGNRHRGPAEPLIGQQPRLPDDVRLLGSAGRPKIVYTRNGSSVGSNTTFTLCDRRGPLKAQRLVLSNGGRLRVLDADPASAASCAAGLP